MFIYDAMFDTQESAALLRAAGAARHRPARGDQVDRRDVLLPGTLFSDVVRFHNT